MVAGVQSWLERAFLRILRSTALPTPTIQRTYRRDGVHIARVDFDFAPLPDHRRSRRQARLPEQQPSGNARSDAATSCNSSAR